MSTCKNCGCYLHSKYEKKETLCFDCEHFVTDSEEVAHGSHIRCPKCKHNWNPYDCEQYKVYEEGEHKVDCPECDHVFEVSTVVFPITYKHWCENGRVAP